MKIEAEDRKGAPARRVWFHWVNDAMEDHPINCVLPYKERVWMFPLTFRAWMHYGRNSEAPQSNKWTAALQLSLLKRAEGLGFMLRASCTPDGGLGFAVCIPWIVHLFFSSGFCRTRSRDFEFEFSYSHGAVTLSLGGLSEEHRNVCPWQRPWYARLQYIYINVADAIFGQRELVRSIEVPRGVVPIPLPEGSYEGRAFTQYRKYARKRWRFWPSGDSYVTTRVTCEDGIPHEGKGENGWDCGEDSIHEVSTNGINVSEAAGEFVRAVLRAREKYGLSTPGAYPHPHVRQRMRAEETVKNCIVRPLREGQCAAVIGK